MTALVALRGKIATCGLSRQDSSQGMEFASRLGDSGDRFRHPIQRNFQFVHCVSSRSWVEERQMQWLDNRPTLQGHFRISHWMLLSAAREYFTISKRRNALLIGNAPPPSAELEIPANWSRRSAAAARSSSFLHFLYISLAGSFSPAVTARCALNRI